MKEKKQKEEEASLRGSPLYPSLCSGMG